MATRKPRPEFSAKALRAIPVDPSLSRAGEEVRVLADGRVIWKHTFSKKYRIWPSLESYLDFRGAAEAIGEQMIAKGPIDPTVTMLPPIDDFLRDVEAHAKSLGPRLGIPDAALDGTVASLEAVDAAMKRIPRPEREVADLVTPLVAYAGEIYRKASGGRWTKPPATYTWWGKERPTESPNEPFITAPNGQTFQPFADVYLPMVEPSKRPPLRPTVEVQLTMAGYSGAP
jgi:hypothetical protein